MDHKETDHLKNPGIDERILIMDHTETGRDHTYWNQLAQDKDKWRALVMTVMNTLSST